MSNLAAVPVPWLNSLIGAADSAVKSYCKQNLELQALVEYYSGDEQRDIKMKQHPVLSAMTTVAAGSNGAVLPQATINVASTAGFDPGTGGNPGATPPTIALQTGITTWTTVTYTAVTATSFTGCAGGQGTLSSTASLNQVGMPVVWYDPGGYYGQAPNSFAASSTGPSTQLVQGTQFVVVLDSGGRTSNRGLIRRLGGINSGWPGFWPDTLYSGKLAGYRLACWPRGDGNLKVAYSAGYAPGKVPFDLQYATAMLCAYMVRVMPNGAPMASESLGAYSYSILTQSLDVPEIGSLQKTLSAYRDSAW